MMDLGADIHKADDDGVTPLHEAAGYRQADVVKMLVAGTADINVAENDGRTPLYWAASNGKGDVVKVLLSLGADKTKADNDFKTPLDVAGNEEIKRMLQAE